MNARFALVDCNNFYASCERVFNPRLVGKPIVILSNNDGCVIARSEEAKQLGIPMGTPAYKHKALFQKNGVQVLSSNYALYGDMSSRVMETLRPNVAAMEVYSIDEAFLQLEDWQDTKFAAELRARVRQWTGIPVSIGIGPTKTLAKIANRIAKKTPELAGVLDLGIVRNIDETLSRIPCEDIWGIGRRLAARLAVGGIRTAVDFKYADTRWVRKTLGVVGERIVRELNGVSCLALEEIPASKKGIASAKSFGRPVQSLEQLEEALSTYTARVGEKLRQGKLLATQVHVFVTTNPFSEKQPQYSAGAQAELASATNHTPELITCALRLLRQIYRPNHQYKKTGIFVSELVAEADRQPDFFEDVSLIERHKQLDSVIDQLNRKLGANAIRYGSMGVKPNWSMRQEKRSRGFTTRWAELPIAKI